jgi:hypothetical protein
MQSVARSISGGGQEIEALAEIDADTRRRRG